MAYKQEVDAAISDNKITIFSKSWCPYSAKAKKLFATEFPDVPAKIYELDQMDEGADIQNYLAEKTGQRTVPNIFIHGKHAGGSDDVHSSFKAGTLKPLVAGTA